MGPDGDLERHRRRRSKKEGARPVRDPCAASSWKPNGSQIAAKWCQIGNKNASKFEVDFEMFCYEKGTKMYPKWQPKEMQKKNKAVPRSAPNEKREHAKSAIGYCQNLSVGPCRAGQLGAKFHNNLSESK